MMDDIKTYNIYQKLHKARALCENIDLTKNSKLGYNYLSSSEVLASVRNAIIIARLHLKTNIIELIESVKDNRYSCCLKVEYTFINIDNITEFDTSIFYCSALNNDPAKAVGSCLTYSEKYFLLKTFNLHAGDMKNLDIDDSSYPPIEQKIIKEVIKNEIDKKKFFIVTTTDPINKSYFWDCRNSCLNAVTKKDFEIAFNTLKNKIGYDESCKDSIEKMKMSITEYLKIAKIE